MGEGVIEISRLLGRTFDAILFDLDGTLVDSRASIERVWRRFAMGEGLGTDYVFAGHGRPARQVLADLVPAGEVERAFGRVQELELNDASTVTAFRGVGAMLAEIPPANWAIVTSCSRPLAAARHRAAGLSKPGVMVTADDVIQGKPHADPYLRAAMILGYPPARCLVVEDAPPGLASGRAAGCATLALGTTYPRDALEADGFAESLDIVTIQAVADGLTVGSRGRLAHY